MRDYKRIPLTNMHNCRDLGGYACLNGGFFQYHKIYRADAPHNLQYEDWDLIKEMGVRTIIDLRSNSEQGFMSYEVPDYVNRVSLPLMTEDIEIKDMASARDSSISAFKRSLSEGYADIMINNTERVAEVLKTIIEGLDSGAVLYHCSAGKDRTGVISAIIYLLCGVEKEDIVADYQVTETYNKRNNFMKKFSATLSEEQKQAWEQMKEMCKSAPENMETFLETIERENLIDKLIASGLSIELIEKLRKSVVSYIN